MSPQRVRVVRQIVALLRETIRAGHAASVAAAAVVPGADGVRLEGQPLHARAGGRRLERRPSRPRRQELDLVAGGGNERHRLVATL